MRDAYVEINETGHELGKLICQKLGWPEEAIRSEWTASGQGDAVRLEFGLVADMTMDEFNELLEQARENVYSKHQS